MDLGLTPDTRWTVDVTTLVEAARDAGYSTLGIHSGLVAPAARTAFVAAGLGCHELLGLVVTDDVATTMGWAEQVTEQAALMQAGWVSTTFKAVTPDTGALVNRCAAMFAEAGAGMAIEFSPLGPVDTMRAGLDLAAVAGVDRAGIVIDSWNFAYGPDTWEDLEGFPLDRIAYVQFNDALAPLSDDLPDEAMNRRTYPGEGVFELERFASALRDRGWDGIVSVQVLSSELRERPIAEFAQRAFDASARYWR